MGGRGGGSPGRQGGNAATATAAPASFEDQLRNAFEANRVYGSFNQYGTRANGVWVSIADLRDAFPDMSRQDFDNAIINLSRQRVIHVIPEEFQRILTPRDRASAIQFGGDDQHLLRFN